MPSPSETSLATPRLGRTGSPLWLGLYWLNFEYFLTVAMAWEQSLELCNSPSGKPPKCPVESEPIRLKLTRQVPGQPDYGRARGGGEVGRGRGRRVIKVRPLVCRCLSPRKSMLMASGAFSRPLTMVSRLLSLPVHFPHAEFSGRRP